jgi:hypothetical protein
VAGVRIRGDGVAARCAAQLLSGAGFPVSVESAARPRVPCILLSHAAQKLIRDVIQSDQLFFDAPLIVSRTVKWGESDPVTLPHSAVVVSEECLLSGMPAAPCDGGEVSWTIDTTPSTEMQVFGTRMASVYAVTDIAPGTCRMKSLEAGWEFLISAGDGSGWRISVGEAGGEFPVAPRIAERLCGPGWLACGSGALAFDPLCGDGTAHAVREAILAAAVIRAAARGEDTDSLLAHYRVRLILGFQRHLRVCREFYGSGGSGPWWRAQCTELHRGLEWCAAEVRRLPPPRYRLEGFELIHLQPGTANDPMRVVEDVAPLFK